VREKALADASFLVALVRANDRHQAWASRQAKEFRTPWLTCEAALAETFYLVDSQGAQRVRALLRHGAIEVRFELAQQLHRVVDLLDKYADVPMSLADACLVRMSELTSDSIVLTTDSHFRTYRRNGRQVVPHLLPR
jgi:predicted nucleic acid-binding protein